MRSFVTFVSGLVLLAGVAFWGCGGRQQPVETAKPAPIKPLLETMAERGEVDSGAILIRERLEAMKETAPAKAEELLAELDKLESARSPRQVRTRAESMAAKL